MSPGAKLVEAGQWVSTQKQEPDVDVIRKNKKNDLILLKRTVVYCNRTAECSVCGLCCAQCACACAVAGGLRCFSFNSLLNPVNHQTPAAPFQTTRDHDVPTFVLRWLQTQFTLFFIFLIVFLKLFLDAEKFGRTVNTTTLLPLPLPFL